MKIPTQLTPTSQLKIYSSNPKVNSVLRTLIAFHGYTHIFTHVQEFLNTKEGKELSDSESWELFQAAKWAQFGDKNE